MGDNSEKSTYQIIGSVAGVKDSDLTAMKQIYDAAKDLLHDYLKFGKDLPAGVGDIIKIADGISTLLGQSKPSEFDRLFAQIKALVAQVEAKIDVLSRQIMGLGLADIDSASDGIRTTARNYADAVAAKKPDVATSPEAYAFGDALLDSAKNFERLTHDAYWHRTFDPTLVCEVDGSQALRYAPPQDTPGMVWDYRAALPILVKVVQTRILCLTLANSPLTAANLDEIDKMADFLTTQHNRVQSGFVVTEVPGVADHMGYLHGDDYKHSTMAIAFWYAFGQPCGAIDRYAGYGAIKTFPLPQPLPVTPPPPSTPSNLNGFHFSDPVYNQGQHRTEFNLLYLVKVLRARAKLDKMAGLPGLRDYIATLRSMTGAKNAQVAPPEPLPFGVRNIATPSFWLLMQLARPMQPLGASNQVFMQFQTGWPTALPQLANYFAKLYGLGKPGSLGSMVTGDDDPG